MPAGVFIMCTVWEQGADNGTCVSCHQLQYTYLKKNLNASRPSEHPPVKGKMSKRLGGIVGCEDKTSSWHVNGFPDGSNIGPTI